MTLDSCYSDSSNLKTLVTVFTEVTVVTAATKNQEEKNSKKKIAKKNCKKITKTITQKVSATKRHICYKENRFHKKQKKNSLSQNNIY